MSSWRRPLATSPGGFRTWWRQRFGADDNLDNNNLMRLAGRFSRRLRAWGAKRGIPFVDATSGDARRMHQLADHTGRHLSTSLTLHQAAYDLGKFRAKGLVQRVPGSIRYQLSTEAVRPLVALYVYVLRDKVIHPLLSRRGHLHRGPLKHQTPVDAQYHRLQREMQQLFKLLRLAA